jgi:hypothetical protein
MSLVFFFFFDGFLSFEENNKWAKKIENNEIKRGGDGSECLRASRDHE